MEQMPSDRLPFPGWRLRASSLSGVGLVPLFRGSGLIRGRLMPAGGVSPSRGPLPGVIRVAGCRVGASPGGVGTALRLTRQGLLQPRCEQDLGVARQRHIEARGGGVVGVGEPDEGGQQRGDQVPVTGQAALGAGVDAVGEGLADLRPARARPGQFRRERGRAQQPAAGPLRIPGRSR